MSDENTPNSDENGLTEQIKWTTTSIQWSDWLAELRWCPDEQRVIGWPIHMQPEPGIKTPPLIQEEWQNSYLKHGRDIASPLTSAIPGFENLSPKEHAGLLKFKLHKMDSDKQE